MPACQEPRLARKLTSRYVGETLFATNVTFRAYSTTVLPT
jgi:hypothetical protein